MRYCAAVAHDEYFITVKDSITISHSCQHQIKAEQKLCQRAAAYNGSSSTQSFHFFNTESLGKVNEVSLISTDTPRKKN